MNVIVVQRFFASLSQAPIFPASLASFWQPFSGLIRLYNRPFYKIPVEELV